MSKKHPRRIYWRPEGLTLEKWNAMSEAERIALARVVAEQLVEAVRGHPLAPDDEAPPKERPS